MTLAFALSVEEMTMAKNDPVTASQIEEAIESSWEGASQIQMLARKAERAGIDSKTPLAHMNALLALSEVFIGAAKKIGLRAGINETQADIKRRYGQPEE